MLGGERRGEEEEDGSEQLVAELESSEGLLAGLDELVEVAEVADGLAVEGLELEVREIGVAEVHVVGEDVGEDDELLVQSLPQLRRGTVNERTRGRVVPVVRALLGL